MNVSSILVRAVPDKFDSVVASLKSSDLCDYHFHDKKQGKIIITIEGENSGEEIAKHKLVAKLPGVLSADMIMTYSEEELEAERERLDSSPNIPAVLNDENIRAEHIVYRGDLRKKKNI